VHNVLATLDDWQRRHRLPGFLWAVQKKFGDDRGGYLAALVTYYGFLSIFPLLLAAFTVVAYVLSGDQSAIHTLERHVEGYPIVGPAASQLAGKTLRGSPLALVVGVAGLVWGAMGLANAAQFTMSEAWNIPGSTRPGMGTRLARGIGWYTVFGLGAVASTFVASLGSILGWAGGPVLSTLISAIIDVALFLASFRILTPRSVKTRAMLPGAAVAGAAWSILTGVGVGLAHKLAHSNELYGSFSSVLALLAFLYLTARITIYGIEMNAVRALGLWPRSLAGKVLAPADRTQLVNLAKRQQRIADQTVEVGFETPPTA
jgi:YihY family inner membrane protein